jgi:hypothetical protein
MNLDAMPNKEIEKSVIYKESNVDCDDEISSVLEDPSEENKNRLLKKVNVIEYSILGEAEDYKNTVYYQRKRSEAFSVKFKVASKILPLWIKKFGSTEGCPYQYKDTLLVPFNSISAPCDV